MFRHKTLLVILLAALLTACPTPTPAPPTPLGLTATTSSSAGIQLSWVASLGASSYTLERRTDATAFASIAIGIRTTIYADVGLQGSTKYTYRVRAIGEGGASNPSAEAFATTLTDLVNLQATATSSVAVNLSWSAVPGATGYTIERKLSMGTYVTVSSPSGTTYVDSALTPNTQYTYRVTAVQPGSSVADEANATTFPSNPTVSTPTATATSVTLTWTAPPEAGTYTFTVERKQGAGAYSSPSSVPTTTYTDPSVTSAATYTYRVKAVSNGVSSSGVEKTVTVPIATPTGFSVVPNSLTTKKVTLTWNTVSGATSYILKRSINGNPFEDVTTTTSTTYTATNLVPSNPYTYRLQASTGTATSVPVDTSFSTQYLSSIRVLFIGNSLTFVNSVPQMIQTLASDAGELHPFQWSTVSPAWQVKSGASLSYHWTNTTDPSPGAQARINEGGWDFVVVQEFSTNPVCNTSSFNTGVTNFANLVSTMNANTGSNAKVILHQNWVVTDNSYIISNCGSTSAYTDALSRTATNTFAAADSQTTRAKVAPVAQAWGNSSGITLQQSDGIHATPEGSYLAAATYYALFYSRSPVGLTNLVKANAAGVIDPNPNLLSNYTVSAASTLQANAWSTVQAMDPKYRLP